MPLFMNIKGADGADGQDGTPGTPGAPGDPGADGTKWFHGNGVPSNGIGADGDYYLNDVNGDVYQKVAGSWT